MYPTPAQIINLNILAAQYWQESFLCKKRRLLGELGWLDVLLIQCRKIHYSFSSKVKAAKHKDYGHVQL